MPEFADMASDITGGLQSGRYKLSDMSSILGSLGELKGSMNENTRELVMTAANMISGAERGQAPDLQKLMNLVMKVKL
jgi:hypothetical protein